MKEKDWCNTCKEPWASEQCNTCKYGYGKENNYNPMTQGDRIRAMSDEELAEWLEEHDFAVHGMGAKKKLILDWLKSPAEEGDNG